MLRRFSDVTIGSLGKLLNHINGNDDGIKKEKKRKCIEKIEDKDEFDDSDGFDCGKVKIRRQK